MWSSLSSQLISNKPAVVKFLLMCPEDVCMLWRVIVQILLAPFVIIGAFFHAVEYDMMLHTCFSESWIVIQALKINKLCRYAACRSGWASPWCILLCSSRGSVHSFNINSQFCFSPCHLVVQSMSVNHFCILDHLQIKRLSIQQSTPMERRMHLHSFN